MGDQEQTVAEFRQQLPELFREILLLFKNAPSNCSWIMEKLMEVFCKQIAHKRDLVAAVEFSSFLNGFLLVDHNRTCLIQYPDFVMNNVSLMAADVLAAATADCSESMSGLADYCDNHTIEPSDQCDILINNKTNSSNIPQPKFDSLQSSHPDLSLIDAAFFIIRHPIEFSMVNKGHRVDVTFRIYRKWVQQRIMLGVLDQVQFDAKHALTHALASPYNYTRQSAACYFVELVCLACSQTPQDCSSPGLSAVRSRLWSCLQLLTGQFTDIFIGSAEGNSAHRKASGDQQVQDFNRYQESVVNFLRLLSECAARCDGWSQHYARTDMFDQVLKLLMAVLRSGSKDLSDHFKSCAVMLLKLATASSDTSRKNEWSHKLVQLLISVSDQKNYTLICDVVYLAGVLLAKLEIEVTADLASLVKLSLLPLLSLLGVVTQSEPCSLQTAMGSMTSFLKVEEMSTSSRLLAVAVDNLFNLTNQQVKEAGYSDCVQYLRMETMNPPDCVSSPLLVAGSFKNNSCLKSIVLVLSKVKQTLSLNETSTTNVHASSNILKAVQLYTKVCLDHKAITCGHLRTVLDSYLAVLNYLASVRVDSGQVTGVPQASTLADLDVLQHVLWSLQFKMLDVDPNVREVALQAAGHLFLTVYSGNPPSDCLLADVRANVSSLWQCLDNKSEGVAMEVVEVLLLVTKAGLLDVLLSLVSVTQEDLVTKLDKFLLSHAWDNIKPVSFDLLTHLCPPERLVRYAEACLRQDNTSLSLTVLDYIQRIFSLSSASQTEQTVDAISSLLGQGWADLVLHKLTAADVSSFRKASAVIGQVLMVLCLPEAEVIIKKRVTDLCEQVGVFTEHQQRHHNYFLSKCQEILDASCNVDGCRLYNALNFESLLTQPFYEGGTVSKCNGGCKINSTNFNNLVSKSQGQNLVCLICTLMHEKIATVSTNGRKQKEAYSSILVSNIVADPGEDQEAILCESCDDFLDSTKELPPVSLSSRPFVSQTKIHEMLSLADISPDSPHVTAASSLLCWHLFRQICADLNPVLLEQEAQRSTDEYERDCMAVLTDCRQVLARNFLGLKVNLQQELLNVFLNSVASLLNTVPEMADGSPPGKWIGQVLDYVGFIQHVLLEEDSVLRFILERRNVLCRVSGESSSNQFILDLFLDRLNQICPVSELGKSCSSHDDLQQILRMYGSGRQAAGLTDSLEVLSSASGDSESSKTVLVHRVVALCSERCGQVQPEISASLECLQPAGLTLLEAVLSRPQQSWEVVHSLLTQVRGSKHKALHLALPLLQDCLGQLILVACDRDDQTRVDRCAKIGHVFGQLQRWLETENDDFDSDNHDDPTAIDCF